MDIDKTHREEIDDNNQDIVEKYNELGLNLDEDLLNLRLLREAVEYKYGIEYLHDNAIIPYDDLTLGEALQGIGLETFTGLISGGMNKLAPGTGSVFGQIMTPLPDYSDIYEGNYTGSDVLLDFIGEQGYAEYLKKEEYTSQEVMVEIYDDLLDTAYNNQDEMRFITTILSGKENDLVKLNDAQITMGIDFYNEQNKETQVAIMALINPNAPISNIYRTIDAIEKEPETKHIRNLYGGNDSLDASSDTGDVSSGKGYTPEGFRAADNVSIKTDYVDGFDRKSALPKAKFTQSGFRKADNESIKTLYVDSFARKPIAPKKTYTPSGFRKADNASIKTPYVDSFARKSATVPKKPKATYSSFRRADIAKIAEEVEDRIARYIF